MLFIGRNITDESLALFCGLLFYCAGLHAQQPVAASDAEPLKQLSISIQNIVAKVSPAIVRVEVKGYGRVDDDSDDEEPTTHLVTKKESLASGIILESDGYIVTNAHVVSGARRVRVILDQKVAVAHGRTPSNALGEFSAVVVGIFAEADLALLKIEATGLPVLPLADSSTIQPGQVVFAVGNPEGLNNSISMGVVSAVARERGAELSPAYIQSDAAINPGSSGGALVDIQGNLVGVTSFIVTEGGGSEGLGFALPSALVHLICGELKAKGRFEVGDIGLRLQAITPTMASGLRLARTSGLIVADVIPGSSAEAVGIRTQDIILQVDGNAVDSLAQYATSFYTKRAEDRMELTILRGVHSFTTKATIQKGDGDPDDLLDQIDMQTSMLQQLGVVAVTLNEKTLRTAPGLRSRAGVLVAGRIAQSEVRTGLGAGDLIRSVNGTSVQTVETLRSLLQTYRSGESVVLQIERHGKLRYLSFDND
jgi:serine protease Do